MDGVSKWKKPLGTPTNRNKKKGIMASKLLLFRLGLATESPSRKYSSDNTPDNWSDSSSSSSSFSQVINTENNNANTNNQTNTPTLDNFQP